MVGHETSTLGNISQHETVDTNTVSADAGIFSDTRKASVT